MKWPCIANAKIVSTMLGPEDHGIMSFFVFVEWPGSGCGLGGYGLDMHDRVTKQRIGSGHAYQAIREILSTVGVATWEKLPGTMVRIEDNGPGRPLTKIGHIMEDRWFDIDEHMKQARDKA